MVAMCWVPNDDPLTKVEVNHKDYCRTNNHASNLEWMSHADNVRYSMCRRKSIRGENNPNYGNRKLSKHYKENPDDARQKQGRPGLKNGRCRAIDIYRSGILIGSFSYIEECCLYIKETYNSSATTSGIRSQIDKSIRTGHPYRGLTFVKH